jgi:hypothetical protein
MWTQERKMKGNRNNRWDLVLTGVLLLSLGTAWAEDRGAENRVVPPFTVSVKDTTLSVKIENVPLGEVLKELTRQAHLEVYLGASSAEEKISARFDNLPFEEGIKRLLRGKNYTLTYTRTAASPRVAEIRVIANGSGPITKIKLMRPPRFPQLQRQGPALRRKGLSRNLPSKRYRPRNPPLESQLSRL